MTAVAEMNHQPAPQTAKATPRMSTKSRGGQPTNRVCICSAIAELNSPAVSSSLAIKQHMQANLAKGKKWLNTMFSSSIKNSVADGTIVKVNDGYKLPPSKNQPRAIDSVVGEPPKRKKYANIERHRAEFERHQAAMAKYRAKTAAAAIKMMAK